MAKKEKVEQLFDTIAGKYDLLNHLLSFQVDKGWRRKAMKYLSESDKEYLLDVACGTADFSLAAVNAGARKVLGMDLSQEMMKIGRVKVEQAGFSDKISFQQGSCEDLPFDDGTFSACSIAFGVRNFEDRETSMRQVHRVLRPGGKLLILEFTLPRNWIFRQLYLFYFNRILPCIGGLISGNKAAYKYLPESVKNFPQPEEFRKVLESVGFKNCLIKRYTGGIVALYIAQKS